VAIGLMLWMQLTATILFLGAAFNLETAMARQKRTVRVISP
jgi:uncharacterized BrkB/YihY/UPF0761 family membrane protein